MRCIWQMEGDKVKGFKCEFSPIDMLMIVSGLKYIVADIERHPKDKERAQGIYNQIMLCRYYDEADRKDEPQTDYKITDTIGYRCPKCGRGNFLSGESNCVYCGEPLIKDEPQTEPLNCRNKDHYASCEYVDKCNPVVCFKALDELNDRVSEQTDCAWK